MKTIKFNLSNTYEKMEAGEKILTITECTPSPSGNPTSVKIVWTDDKKKTINETIDLSRALWKISRICEAVLKVQDGEEMSIEEMCKELLNKQVKCLVEHKPGNRPREDGTIPTFANVTKILGGVEESTSATPTQTENPRSSILAGL